MEKQITRHILVALDLSMMDKYILSFLKTNSEVLTTEKILFIHVNEELSKDDDDNSKANAGKQNKENLLNQIKTKVEESFPEASHNYEVRLVGGDPEKEIRQFSREQDIDLLVVGQKATTKHEIKVKRLVKRAGTSLLRIPKKNDYAIQTICVATDFSELSKIAAKEAHTIAQKLGAKLIGLHSYQVPSGYHKTGKDHWESAEAMEKNAKKDAESFWKELGINTPEMEYVYDVDKEPAACITNFAEENEIDLLVIGSKGRTAAASILMGSVAKEVTQLLHTVPLMILKEKNKNMDLLDAIKEI